MTPQKTFMAETCPYCMNSDGFRFDGSIPQKMFCQTCGKEVLPQEEEITNITLVKPVEEKNFAEIDKGDLRFIFYTRDTDVIFDVDELNRVLALWIDDPKFPLALAGIDRVEIYEIRKAGG